MERKNILDYLVNNRIEVKKVEDNSSLLLDMNNVTFELEEISLADNVNVNLLLSNIKEGNAFYFTLGDNVTLNVKGILKDELKMLKISAKLGQNSKISLYFADFMSGDNMVDVDVILAGNGSLADWHLASLSTGEDRKEFDISLVHIGNETYGLSDNYGVSKDNSRLVFSGISHIKNGSKNSKTRQNAKIMVFDEKSIGIARPVLKIDENEIEASHGASVGKISDDQMFYLTSRGLSETEAKRLITLGYLRPILLGFEEEELKEEISSLIARKI